MIPERDNTTEALRVARLTDADLQGPFAPVGVGSAAIKALSVRMVQAELKRRGLSVGTVTELPPGDLLALPRS